MTKETLEKATKISNTLKECEKNLIKIRYTQIEHVAIRESYFRCNGIEDSVIIPKNLFRIIGKLIQSEYIQEINKLQKELNEL